MRLLQLFETTIFSDSSEHAIHAVIVPSRSFSEMASGLQVQIIANALGLPIMIEHIAPSSLGSAFGVLSSPFVPQAELTAQLMAVLEAPGWATAPWLVAPIDKEFAERVAFDNFVPFEGVADRTPIVRETRGYRDRSGHWSLRWVCVSWTDSFATDHGPAGMVICCAAKGIADALEQGLRERLLRFLKGTSA